MRRAQPESRLQRAILKRIAALGFTAVHVPNGAKLAGNEAQRRKAGARLKADGVMAGFPDLLVYGSQGRIGHVEVKVEGNYQTDTQKRCQAFLTALGHHYAVCRSQEDVDETLQRWGWL